MINCNTVGTKKSRYSTAYVRRSDNHYFSELPEDATESDYAAILCGRVRCDQTGVIYETAVDAEDAPWTYTEVFPDPVDISEWVQTYNNPDYFRSPRFYDYSIYNSSTTYTEGDIVVNPGSGDGPHWTWICTEESVQGFEPPQWGFEEYMPYINVREPTYKTLAEIYPEEQAAEE